MGLATLSLRFSSVGLGQPCPFCWVAEVLLRFGKLNWSRAERGTSATRWAGIPETYRRESTIPQRNSYARTKLIASSTCLVDPMKNGIRW